MDRDAQRAVLAWCVVVALFGVGLAGSAFAATDAFASRALVLLGHPGVEWSPPLRFAVALMGAVTLGWGLTIAAVASVGDRLPPGLTKVLWRRLAASVLVWFLVDSALSIATGFALNAASNVVLFAALIGIVAHSGVFGRS